MIEARACSPAGDGFACLGNAITNRVGQSCRVERSAAVERDDVARNARLVLQHFEDLGARLVGIGHGQIAAGRHAQAKILRLDLVLAHGTIAQFSNHGRGAERDLVHPILAPDHHRALCAKTLQHPHLDAHEVGMEHAHQDVRRTRRIGQRPEDVEDGAHPHLLAHRCDDLHRRMVIGCEHETDAGFGDALGHTFRRQINDHTQRFQHVGAAGLG